MGFPGRYSEIAVPRLLLQALILLSYVQRLFFRVFNAVGYGDLLDADMLQERPLEHHDRDTSQFPQLRSMSAALMQMKLPTLRYAELVAEENGRRVGGGCAVCLHELAAADEVRRLSNCRHVFHRACLDQWVEYDRMTCPLCRAPLVPVEAEQDGAFGGRPMRAYAAVMPDAEYVDESSPSTSSLSPWFRC